MVRGGEDGRERTQVCVELAEHEHVERVGGLERGEGGAALVEVVLEGERKSERVRG